MRRTHETRILRTTEADDRQLITRSDQERLGESQDCCDYLWRLRYISDTSSLSCRRRRTPPSSSSPPPLCPAHLCSVITLYILPAVAYSSAAQEIIIGRLIQRILSSLIAIMLLASLCRLHRHMCVLSLPTPFSVMLFSLYNLTPFSL